MPPESGTKTCGACGESYVPSDDSGMHSNCAFSVARFTPSDVPTASPGVIGDSDKTMVAPSDVTRSSPSDPNRPPSSSRPASSSSGSYGVTKKRTDPNLPPEVQEAAKLPKNLLNQYILVKQIGKGGMGTVWKAFDKRLLRWAAIKFLITDDEEGVMRFEREAQLAARLRHPNIAPIYEVVKDEVDHPFIAMEFIDGTSFDKAQLTLRETIDLFAKVCDGMEAAHKADVVHRDLKPQNIMVTKEKWPYVMDFGLAKALQTESSLSVSGAIMGTPAYMPPEQAQGKLEEIDPRTDVYSLGATLYAILTRKQPFTGQTPMDTLMKVCKEDPVAPRQIVPEIPEEIETIILKAMSKEKKDRYQSATEMGADLRQWLSGGEIAARAPTTMQILIRKVKRNFGIFIAGAAVLLAGIVVTIVMTRPAPRPVDNGGSGSNQAAEEWLKVWGSIQEKLKFESWQPGDGGLASQAQAHLQKMEEIATPTQVQLVKGFFDKQLDDVDDEIKQIHRDRSLWAERASRVSRVQVWCDVVTDTVRGVSLLNSFQVKAGKIRATAAEIAGYKGVFTLKIAVAPYAKVTKLSRNNQALPLAQADTPLVLADLEVGAYDIEFSHPQLGKQNLTLAAEQLKNGKTYLVSGSMKGGVKVRELP